MKKDKKVSKKVKDCSAKACSKNSRTKDCN